MLGSGCSVASVLLCPIELLHWLLLCLSRPKSMTRFGSNIEVIVGNFLKGGPPGSYEARVSYDSQNLGHGFKVLCGRKMFLT